MSFATAESSERSPVALYHFKSSIIPGRSSWMPLSAQASLKAQPLPNTLRVATWNIWFDSLLKNERTNYLLDSLQREDPDVICLQEVTSSVEKAIRENKFAQKNWRFTSFEDQANFDSYVRLGDGIQAIYSPFPITDTGRSLLSVELTDSRKLVRVGTVHLNYTPKRRRAEFEQCITELNAQTDGGPVPVAVLCGDTNIDSYEEIKVTADAGFVDSFLAANPQGPADEQDLYVYGATFGTAMTKPGSKQNYGEYKHRRLDYALVKEGQVKSCRPLGTEPMPKNYVPDWSKYEGVIENAYASDHTGLIVEIEL
ncbi:Endonuclease/exonuclease/phosphatase [Flagelloscypha sp. PMI_526]|nr:Endonuclease/exonuclease/phosphatase [Flagelloscypha sp. PMI_526]